MSRVAIFGLPGSGTSTVAETYHRAGYSDCPPTYHRGEYKYEIHERLQGRGVNWNMNSLPVS